MKGLYTLAVVCVILSTIFSIVLTSHPAVYVIGGEYIVPQGTRLDADMLVLFARVSLEPGVRINGQVISLCSELQMDGALTGGLLNWDILGYKILLPEIRRLQVGS